jgi:hypothetical protein
MFILAMFIDLISICNPAYYIIVFNVTVTAIKD